MPLRYSRPTTCRLSSAGGAASTPISGKRSASMIRTWRSRERTGRGPTAAVVGGARPGRAPAISAAAGGAAFRAGCALSRANVLRPHRNPIEDVLGELGQPNLPGSTRASRIGDASSASTSTRSKRQAGRSHGSRLPCREKDAGGRGPSALATPPPRATTGSSSTRILPSTMPWRSCPIWRTRDQPYVRVTDPQARPGSMHGYDIVDHTAINPELGGEEGFYRLIRRSG